MSTCKRCGEQFTPEPTGIPALPLNLCCSVCRMRNLFDGLGLPTPPTLLDIYTKHPTLTDEEFHARLI